MSHKLKNLMKEYGPAAIVTFNLLSFTSLTAWISAIHFGANVDPLINKITEIKKYVGFEPVHEEPSSNEPLNSNDINWKKLGTTLTIAYAGHYITMPLIIGITALLTPSMKRILAKKGIWKFFMK